VGALSQLLLKNPEAGRNSFNSTLFAEVEIMKVILTENIMALGQIGQIVNVAPGYARNYLLPQGLALEATGKNVVELEHKKRVLAQKRERVHQEMLSLAEKLNQVQVVFRRKVIEEDKLYGSVSSADILAVLDERGFELPRKSVQLDQPIKALGEFAIPVRVDAQITAQVKLIIQKEE
jgi:large subunit ribosomal protein L9